MSQGEKMIWAAAFVRHLDIANPPADVVRDPEVWGAWERDRAADAVEAANVAVDLAQRALARVAEGWGADSECYQQLAEMLGSHTQKTS